MRTLENFVGDFNQYVSFPFERIDLSLRFELLPFELDDQTYKFDMYFSENQISMKLPELAGLQDYQINFNGTDLQVFED